MLTLRPPSTFNRAPDRGFSLIEVVVTSSVLLIGLLAITMTVLASSSLGRSEREGNMAENAMRAVLGRVQGISRAAAVEDPATWASTVTQAFEPGSTPGDRIEIRGLEEGPGTPAAVTIEVLTDETLTDFELGTRLGMPRDLDGDGQASNTDVTSSARLLPIVLRLRWTGVGGERELIQGTHLLGL